MIGKDNFIYKFHQIFKKSFKTIPTVKQNY